VDCFSCIERRIILASQPGPWLLPVMETAGRVPALNKQGGAGPRASIEKLRKDAANAALIRDLATDPIKWEMYDRLHRHLNGLADEVERAMNAPKDLPTQP
jgi:hypothetical protein